MKNVMKIKEVLPIYNLAYMASTIDKRMVKGHVGTKQGFIYGVNSAINVNVLAPDAEYVSMTAIRRAKDCAVQSYIANPVPYYKSRLVLWTLVEAALSGAMSVKRLREKAEENRRNKLGIYSITKMDVQQQLEELQKYGFSLRDIERAARSIRRAEEIMEEAAA